MTAQQRLRRDYFERLYREHSDPWAFEESAYEHEKYARTLSALEDRRFGRCLDVGCSIGVLTEWLATRCEEIVAVDVAEQAVESARKRLAHLPGVTVEQRELPEQLPGGEFDLIVCSEVLYYWDRALLMSGLARLEARVAPGGSLLAVHWRPQTETYPLQGDEVHELLHEHTSLEPAWELVEEEFRIDRFDRAP